MMRNNDTNSAPEALSDIALLLSQATSADMLIDALNSKAVQQHYIRASYLIGISIVERWPSEWPRALDCLLGGLARCTESFGSSLRCDDIEWAGCAAYAILSRRATAHYNNADNELLRKLASFSYYSLSYIIRSKERCTVNALMTRSAIMRGDSAIFVDGPLPGTPPYIPIMCSIADYHDALVKHRELGFETPLYYLINHATPASSEDLHTADLSDIPFYMRHHVIEAGHFIHAHLYRTGGMNFEQGRYNIFCIANLRSIVSGCADG